MGCRPSKQARSKIRAVELKNDFPCLCSPRKLRKSQSHHKCCEAADSTGEYSECGRSSSAAAASNKTKHHSHHPHYHRQHGNRRSCNMDYEDSSVSCHHSYSTGHRPVHSKSADNTDFPAFSTTTAVYRRSASKTSKITLRLSCDGSTLEIEQCDYDLDRDNSKASPMPRPWRSAPNLTKLNTENKGRLFKNANMPLKKKSPGNDRESCEYRPSSKHSPSDNHPSHATQTKSASQKGSSNYAMPLEVSVDVMAAENRNTKCTCDLNNALNHYPNEIKRSVKESRPTFSKIQTFSVSNDLPNNSYKNESIWAPIDLQRRPECVDQLCFQNKDQAQNLQIHQDHDFYSSTVPPNSVYNETLDERMVQLERSLELNNQALYSSKVWARRSQSMTEPTKQHFEVRSQSMVEPTDDYFVASKPLIKNCRVAVNPTVISQALASTGTSASEVVTAKTSYIFHKPTSNMTLELGHYQQYNSHESSDYADISPDFERIPVHVISSLIKPLAADQAPIFSYKENTLHTDSDHRKTTQENTICLEQGPTAILQTQGLHHNVSRSNKIKEKKDCDFYKPFSSDLVQNVHTQSDFVHFIRGGNMSEGGRKSFDDSGNCISLFPECTNYNFYSDVFQSNLDNYRRQSSDLKSLSSVDSDSVMALVTLGCPVDNEDSSASFMSSGEDKCPLSLFTPEHQVSCPLRDATDIKSLCEKHSASHGYAFSYTTKTQPTDAQYDTTKLVCLSCGSHACRHVEGVDIEHDNSNNHAAWLKNRQAGSEHFSYDSNVFSESGGIVQVLPNNIAKSGESLCDDPHPHEVRYKLTREETGSNCFRDSVDQPEYSEERSQASTKSPGSDLFVFVVNSVETSPSCLEDFSLCNKQDSCEEESIERNIDNTAKSASVEQNGTNTSPVGPKKKKKDRSHKKMRKKKKFEACQIPKIKMAVLPQCTVEIKHDRENVLKQSSIPCSDLIEMIPENMKKNEQVILSPIVTCSEPTQSLDEENMHDGILHVQDSADYLVELLHHQDTNSLSPSPRWERQTRFRYDFDYLKANEVDGMSVSDASDYEISPLYYKKLGDPFLDDELDIFTSMYGVKKAILARNLETSMKDFEKVSGSVFPFCAKFGRSRILEEEMKENYKKKTMISYFSLDEGNEKTILPQTSRYERSSGIKRKSHGEKSNFLSLSSASESQSSSSISSKEETSDESVSSSTSSSPSYDSSNYVVFCPSRGSLVVLSESTNSNENKETSIVGNKLKIIQAWVLDGYLEKLSLDKHLLSFSDQLSTAKKLEGIEEDFVSESDSTRVRDIKSIDFQKDFKKKESTHNPAIQSCALVVPSKKSQGVLEQRKHSRIKSRSKATGKESIKIECFKNQDTAKNPKNIPSEQELLLDRSDVCVNEKSNKKVRTFGQNSTHSLLSTYRTCSKSGTGRDLTNVPAKKLASEPSSCDEGFEYQHLRTAGVSNERGSVHSSYTGSLHRKGQTIQDKKSNVDSPRTPSPSSICAVNTLPLSKTPPLTKYSSSGATEPLLSPLCVSSTTNITLCRHQPASWDSNTTEHKFGFSIDRTMWPGPFESSPAFHSSALRSTFLKDESTKPPSSQKGYNSVTNRQGNSEYNYKHTQLIGSKHMLQPEFQGTNMKINKNVHLNSAITINYRSEEFLNNDQNESKIISTRNRDGSCSKSRIGSSSNSGSSSCSSTSSISSSSNSSISSRDRSENNSNGISIPRDSLPRLANAGGDTQCIVTSVESLRSLALSTHKQDNPSLSMSRELNSPGLYETGNKAINLNETRDAVHANYYQYILRNTNINENCSESISCEGLNSHKDIRSGLAESGIDKDGRPIKKNLPGVLEITSVKSGTGNCIPEQRANFGQCPMTTIISPSKSTPEAMSRASLSAPRDKRSGLSSSSQGDLLEVELGQTSRRPGKTDVGCTVNKKNRVSWPGSQQSKVLSLVSYFEKGGGSRQGGV